MPDLNEDDARQGVTGHGVRYVLAISVVLAIGALVVIAFAVG